MPKKRHLIQILSLLVLLSLLVSAVVLPVGAEGSRKKIVRVGWYDATYNTVDENGKRTGYAYEYQVKLSAYNGWSYEYVQGSWADLLDMLKTGKIDLMSDVSYTPEREAYMSFASLPMGTEEYYLFTAPGNEEISATDPSTLVGKKVGVNRDSIQAQFYADWAKENKVQPDVIELSCSEEESLQMLESGALDAYITVDSFVDPSRAVPVYKIGSSDYYFAVSKTRPDLLEELNDAMSKIQDENRYYNLQMYEKYIRKSGANAYLSSKETEWLKSHGKIRIGYQDNYLAFCAKDKKSGELVGVLGDYLKLADDYFSNAHIELEAIAYPTAEEAMKALELGKIDCMFPANLSAYEAETRGIVMTPSLLDTEMYAVVRAKDPNIFEKDKKVVVAVNEGNVNYEAFLAAHYPDWEKAYFSTSEDCINAVAKGKADCLIISNYRYNNIARLCEKNRLTTFSIGVELEYCFAVEKGQTTLYSILSKVISMVPDSAINASLSQNLTEEAKMTFSDFLEDHLGIVMIIALLIFLVFLALLLQNMRAVKKAKKLIQATETDDLTGLYTRKYFFQYANRLYREHPHNPMDAIVLNLEQFHSINEIHGRKLGDQVLRVLGNEIRDISQEKGGIAGRFEADRFNIYCRPCEDYKQIFDHLQTVLDGIASNLNLRLRMGVMPWQENMDLEALFDRARTACNMARGHYKEHLIIYDERVSERESFEQRLINDFRHALETKEFEIFYQPKYNIKVDPPQLYSTEALVRWNHPELGVVSPGDFIPLFERNGQIGLLDKYVWSQAARQVAEWKETYGITLPVSVNISRVDVFDPQLEQTLENILSENHLDHQSFKLEITESAYTESADQVIEVVESLRQKGFQVEMDDFGTGYSSLSMLSSMPIDALKMDMQFIRDIDYDEKNRQMVTVIMDIAKTLKLPVIAEGVETQSQLELLKSMGFSLVQGYYFSRPLPAEDFAKRFFEENQKGEN
ncbi:MAG: EAL domain-containing protein [Clostridia bacterium]|nr:EAL domain-containing protein [Clostridia bacterium]